VLSTAAQTNKKSRIMEITTTAYDSQWDKVQKSEQESLPQSALEIVGQIFQQALKEGNSPQLIKAIIYQLKYETVINNNVLPEKITELKKFVQADQNPVEQAILYSLLAELYYRYYQADLHLIQQRTAISSSPEESGQEDIREWPANFFIWQIVDCLNLSLLPANELQTANVRDYKEIIEERKTSRSLSLTLYDFLLQRKIEIFSHFAQNSWIRNLFPQTKLSESNYFASLNEFVKCSVPSEDYDFTPQIVKLYQDLLSFRRQQDDAFSLLMIDLERLEFVYKNTSTDTAGEEYIEALNDLEKQYAEQDFCVEILHKKTIYYSEKNDKEGLFDENGFPIGQQETIKQAYEICLEGIRKYPHYERIGVLQNQLNAITRSQVNVQSDNTAYPGKDLKLTINYRNINRLSIEVYRIKVPVSVYVNSWSRNGQYKENGVLTGTYQLDLINEHPYLYSDTTFRIPTPELGNYEYVIYSDSLENTLNQQFSVSRLATVSRVIDGKRDFLILDRFSGKPAEGAQIRFYKRKSNTLELLKNETAIVDKLGLSLTNSNENAHFYQVCLGNDTSLLTSPVPWLSSSPQKTENSRKVLDLFTDRNIYRPGQVVYFKGIAYETGNDIPEIIPNQSYILTLRDANGKEVASKNFVSNEWGSIAGEFILPQGLLNGNFSIQSDKVQTRAYFRVEEYKRPTFDIRFDKNEKAYRLGDEVRMKGNAKTFSGVNLQETKVQYRITRSSHWLFSRIWRQPLQIADGEVLTQEDGSFEIAFIADSIPEDRSREDAAYVYTIEASITNSGGETQGSTTTVSIGNKSLYLEITGLNDKINKETLPSLKIGAFNLNRNPVQAKGSYEIYGLKPESSSPFDWQNNEWTQDKKIHSGSFESGKEFVINQLKSLPSGPYRLLVKADDEQGREIETQKDFILFSSKDKQPPVPVYEWLIVTKDTCSIGEKAEISYGSSAKKVYVLYEIFQDNQRISASRFMLNNEIKKIEIPFLSSYNKGVVASFTFIKDGKVFTQSINICKRKPDKKLGLKMDVFRDRLLPGQKEEWKISVKDSAQKPVVAELLAGMYDASLDKIYQSYSWGFNPIPSVYLFTPSFNHGNEFNVSNATIEYPVHDLVIPLFHFDRFNWFGWDIYSQSSQVLGVRRASVNALSLADHEMVQEEKAEIYNLAEPIVEPEIQLRQNFNETAFFYPQLKTDEMGETLISFTVPESNTTWKFMALAHTKELKYGQIIEQAISQKQLMITPNIPRFIRQGDKMTISSTISNLSETALTGNVSIECFDPNTLQPMIAIAGSSKTFSVEADKTTTVSWTFEVPKGIDLTALKIVARSADFSDGEQHLIPVLPNRMLVTESLPLTIRGGRTQSFSFDKMKGSKSSTLENYRLTLEFTGNPVWYAVQALPLLTTPQSEDALSWFAAYYSNVFAARIAGSSPKIRQIVDSWTKQGGTKETLLSNLEKNQELKAALLEETPWVMEAANETEQKQSLSLLFDLNRMDYLNAQALEKLQSLQTEDGGWSWFKGMGSNVSITQWLLYGMGELSRNGVQQNSKIKQMQEKAVRFIDEQFRKQFEEFKKQNKSWKSINAISTYELEYLLVRSYYEEIPLDATQEAVSFYTALAQKYWVKNTGLYARAIAALFLQRKGDTEIATSIVKSLREHASHKPDLGMFWANNKTRSFLFQSATCVHTFIMEAFQEIGSSSEEMDDMKYWLLKQKQTQEWESVPATVSAVNILLKTGTDWLSSEGKATIQWGDNILETAKGEAGTGHIKEVFEAKDILPSMSQVKISKEDQSPGWGALYWQYFEDLDKITSAQTGLNVEKSLFVEKITASGKRLSPVTEADPLKVGDKAIVRLTVRSDRDMEYVHLKDMRASCFEPVEQLSGLRWAQVVTYYQAMKDASMNFYFNNLPKGTYVFEYPLYVVSAGDYSNGITRIQCLYAPEFVSHTSGGRVRVER
jgi:uncharacterized protein YfaS (alpha-2-macroglobulin family)